MSFLVVDCCLISCPETDAGCSHPYAALECNRAALQHGALASHDIRFSISTTLATKEQVCFGPRYRAIRLMRRFSLSSLATWRVLHGCRCQHESRNIHVDGRVWLLEGLASVRWGGKLTKYVYVHIGRNEGCSLADGGVHGHDSAGLLICRLSQGHLRHLLLSFP